MEKLNHPRDYWTSIFSDDARETLNYNVTPRLGQTTLTNHATIAARS